MNACDLIIKCSTLVTQNTERALFDNAAMAVKNGKIMAVGTQQDIMHSYDASEVLDLSGHMVMPGLINAHTHVSMTLLRGLADDLPLMEWLTKHIFPVEQKLTPEHVRLGALLGCAEMIRTGTTAFCDMYLMEHAVAKAVDEAGLRAVVGEVIFEFPSPAYADLNAAMDVVRDMHDTYKDHDRIRTAVMPHAVYTTNPELLTRAGELAEELDIPLHIHLAESASETAQSLERFSKRPIEHLDALGLIQSRTHAAHCVDMTDDEIALFARKGIRVSHNPESNMKLASGISPVQKLLNAGIPVGLGTDGACSNNNLNMFEEMGSAALLAKVSGMDPTALDAQTVLDMATRGGAACLDWPAIGSLEPGQAADCIAIDLSAPNLMPMYSPVSHAVYSATGNEVAMTMVSGEILYNKGKYTRFDYPALLEEIRELAKWVRAQVAGGNA